MAGRDPGLYSSGAEDGRAMLRTLRETAGLSQMEVAGRASDAGIKIDQAHLQKIESGRIKHPTAETIDAILTNGLGVPYRVRIDVLAAFGYRLKWELPTEREGELELRMNAGELGLMIWPGYLQDFSLRIWGWNPLFPRLLGHKADNPENARYRGLTILDILLNPAISTHRQIANTAAFTPLIVAGFKIMTKAHWHEPWFQEFMTRAKTWPGFLEMWDRTPDGPEILLVEHPTAPVEIQVPNVATPMLFRVIVVPITLDPRFSNVHLVPMNVETQAVCAAWAAEDAANA